MTQRTRKITRITTSPSYPAWRQAMTQTNRLYKVSNLAPDSANGSLVFPGGVVPYGFGSIDTAGWDVMSGYSSGTLIEDVGGAYGTMVYATGGHTRVQNQILSLSISNDAPTFGWWMQPYYQTSSANGAELYYNPTEFQALPATRRTGSSTFGGQDENTATPLWLAAGGFAQGSMGYEGWMFPAKLQYGDLGNFNCHGWRFSMPCYIPPSMTGTGAGGFVVTQGAQGPFSQSYRPGESAISDMMNPAFIFPSGQRKFPYHIRNTQTGVWSLLNNQFIPDLTSNQFYGHASAVAVDQKRIYYATDKAGASGGWWYVDFTNGAANATVSSFIRPSPSLSPHMGCQGAFTAGHPTGRHLWFWPDLTTPTALICMDLDAGTHASVDLASKGWWSVPGSVEIGMSYDPVLNRILAIQTVMGPYSDRTFLDYRTITIPSDPFNAANYVVSAVTRLSIDVSVPQPLNVITWLYSKAFYHRGLGVMFVPQDRAQMLAFRPG